MKLTEQGQPEVPTEPAPSSGQAQGENPSLVHVLTTFLQDASKYVLEDDWESYYT
jgi:hypothetical protein